MAKVWPVYEGTRPTAEWPWARLPLSEATALFELKPHHFVSDLSETPRFGAVDRDLTYAGYKHIVVEIEPVEARQKNWKPGFYQSPVKPRDAFGRLIRQALASELGNENVVRIDWRPGMDSQGREALKITVVIAPGAARKFREGAALDALVRLQDRLRELRDDRVPIVEYATEAELAQDVGP
jgi:hypothetical protein